MTYIEQLESNEWWDKSDSIKRRDYGRCYFCESTANLQVHHKYYIYGHKAWEYPDDALVTLCGSCHRKMHNLYIPAYFKDNKKTTKLSYKPCCRCNGVGYLKQYEHIDDGICFRCMGSGLDEVCKENIFSFENAKSKLDAKSKTMQDLAKHTNNPDLLFEINKSHLKIQIFEHGTNNTYWYYLKFGYLLSRAQTRMTEEFILDHIGDLRIVQTMPDEGFMYLESCMNEINAALEYFHYLKIKYPWLSKRLFSIKTKNEKGEEVVIPL